MLMRLLGFMLFALALSGMIASCVHERQQPVNERPCASNATMPVLKSDDTQKVDTHDKGVGGRKMKLPPPVTHPPTEPPNDVPGTGQLMAPIVPLRTISGSKSAITKLEVQLATDSAAILALWLRHNKEEAAPDVDFANEMVLAVFAGNRHPFAPIFHHVLKGQRYYVDLELGVPAEQAGEAAFALFVMPRLNAPIVVEDRIWPDKKVPARFETLAVLQPNAPLLKKHGWWPVAQYSGSDGAIGDPEGASEVVLLSYAWDDLWQKVAPGKAAPAKKGGVGIVILGGKTKGGAPLELYDVLMGANQLVFRFERVIDTKLDRDTFPYLVLELPSIDDPNETDVGLFFEERERRPEYLLRFKGVDPKRVYIDEYRK
jgi:hypothetical protein